MKFKEIIKSNGFLTDQGQQLVNQQFMPAVKELLAVAESENQVRIIGSLLSNLIGKEVTNMVAKHTEMKRETAIKTIGTVLSEGLKQEFLHPAATDPFDNTEKNRQAILDKSKEILNPLFLMLEGNEGIKP